MILKKKSIFIFLSVLLFLVTTFVVIWQLKQPSVYKNTKYKYELLHPRNAEVEFIAGNTNNIPSNTQIENADIVSITLSPNTYMWIGVLKNDSVSPRALLLTTQQLGNSTIQIFGEPSKSKYFVVKSGDRGLIISARQSMNGPAIDEEEILNNEGIVKLISSIRFF